MAAGKRWYRSRDALVGGVCAGAAERFDLDPLVTRILTVMISVATLGAGVVAYAVLWLVLPLAPKASEPVDVRPESVQSDMYGRVGSGEVSEERSAAQRSAASAAAQVAAGYAAHATFTGTGHVPPVPPRACVAGAAASPIAAAVAASDVPPSAAPAPASPVPSVAAPASSRSIRAAVWLGLMVLAVALCALFANCIVDFSWWQFCPLFIVVVGVGLVVAPASAKEHLGRIAIGIALAAFGMLLLAMTCGVARWESLGAMTAELWPLLLVAIGLFLLGNVLPNRLFSFAAAACLALFCILGLALFAVPGDVDTVTFLLPFKGAVTVDVNPWM